MARSFAWVEAYQDTDLPLPRRQSAHSAGYDIAAVESCTVEPGCIVLVPTGLKVYMHEDDVVLLSLRSSLAHREALMMPNGIGVIDADYADNPDNEGHINVMLMNAGSEPVFIARGQRIAQAVFITWQRTDDDEDAPQRQGGFGSTGISSRL